jgi:hypothetical protein
MDYSDVYAQKMNNEQKNLKTILKFDVGADGFQKMIYVLAVCAAIVLMVGIYFINVFMHEVRQMS